GGEPCARHLAVALGTPAVAIFGPPDPARNGPYRPGGPSGKVSPVDIVLRSPHAVTTYKRSDQAAPSILEIDVDTVFDAARRQLESRRRVPQAVYLCVGACVCVMLFPVQ